MVPATGKPLNQLGRFYWVYPGYKPLIMECIYI